jgi:hypothetical protein
VKKIGMLILLLLSFNFLAVAGGVGYLVGTGKIDKEKAKTIGKLIFPDPAPPTSQPTTDESTIKDPLMRFDDLLIKTSSKSAAEQVAIVQDTFLALNAQLDQKNQEIRRLKLQVDLAQEQLERDRAAVLAREKALTQKEQSQDAQAKDEGFNQSLAVYNKMPSKQVKDIFMNLEEATVVRYLQAMDDSRAGRILKEFKAPAEQVKAQTLLEMMRKNNATQEAASVMDGTS